MPDNDDDIEALVTVIETLKQRIGRDRATIEANEIRTRNALIDPLLAALGWADSSVITSEYLIRSGPNEADYLVADYALHAAGQRAQPIAFIEAKRMREDLNDDHRNQVLAYAYNRRSVKYFGLTNGDLWEVYEINGDNYCLLLDISIQNESAIDCALEFLQFKRVTEHIVIHGPESTGDIDSTEVFDRTSDRDLEPTALSEDPRKTNLSPIRTRCESYSEPTRVVDVTSWM